MDEWWMTQGPQSSLCASRCDGSSNVAEQGRPSGHPWVGGGPLGQCFLVPATGTGLLILANVEKVSQLKICPLCLPTAGANALDAMCCAKNKKFLFPRSFPPPKAAAGLQQGALSSPVPHKGRKFPGYEASSGIWSRTVWKTCVKPHFCPENSKFYCILSNQLKSFRIAATQSLLKLPPWFSRANIGQMSAWCSYRRSMRHFDLQKQCKISFSAIPKQQSSP